MYPYHNKIKQRISNGELVDYRFVENYNNIGECLLLFFETAPYIRPIRPYRYNEYIELLEDFKNSIDKGLSR